MSGYTNVPAIDALSNFPPKVRKALASSTEFTTKYAPLPDFLVDSYRQTSDPDDTLSFARCWAAMQASPGGGIMKLSAKSYHVTALPHIRPPAGWNSLPYAIQGPGSSICSIHNTGTSFSSSLIVDEPNFYWNGGACGSTPMWGGFELDGTGSTGGTSGLSWGDISSGYLVDILIHEFATGDGLRFPNDYGWCEDMVLQNIRSINNLNQVHFAVGLGNLLGAITPISSGATVTSIAVPGGVKGHMWNGQPFVLSDGSTNSQDFYTTADVLAGAKTIPVVSTTADGNFTGAYVGSWGSFDYWTVSSLYIGIGANQNGIVSDKPLGKGQRIDRIGAFWRVTGNSGNAVGNTGALLWTKGNDNWAETVFDLAVEAGGVGDAHTSLKLDDTDFSATGRFIASNLGACKFAKGAWQYALTGRVNITGITNPNGSWSAIWMQPGGIQRNITQGTVWQGYPTTVSSGVSWRNDTGADVLVTIPVTFTGAGNASYNVESWSGLPVNPAPSIAAPSAGFTLPLTFVHYAGSWARVDVTNATLGRPTAKNV